MHQAEHVGHPSEDRETLTPQVRFERMQQAARLIREDVSDDEWAVIEQAMNHEPIESWNEAMWRD